MSDARCLPRVGHAGRFNLSQEDRLDCRAGERATTNRNGDRALMLPAEIVQGLKLVGEKLDKAVADRQSQRGALAEVAGVVPAIRDYIKAEDVRIASAMLVCEQLTFDDDWWEAFGKF
jgi:hypothetical protein